MSDYCKTCKHRTNCDFLAGFCDLTPAEVVKFRPDLLITVVEKKPVDMEALRLRRNETQRNYYRRNVEAAVERAKRWREQNPEKFKESNKRYVDRNRAKVYEVQRAYRARKREKVA